MKHVSMMIMCVRSFIIGLAEEVAATKLVERPLVNLLGEVWDIVTSQHATKSAKLWGFDFHKIWPIEELKKSGGEKIARWLEHRLV